MHVTVHSFTEQVHFKICARTVFQNIQILISYFSICAVFKLHQCLFSTNSKKHKDKEVRDLRSSDPSFKSKDSQRIPTKRVKKLMRALHQLRRVNTNSGISKLNLTLAEFPNRDWPAIEHWAERGLLKPDVWKARRTNPSSTASTST